MVSIAVHFAYYNFCRVHQTLRVTTAMEAGLADSVWGIEKLIAELDRRSALAPTPLSMKPDPNPTEGQQFGVVGLLLVAGAVAGIFYALARVFK